MTTTHTAAPLTEAEIAETRAICDAATKGPWRFSPTTTDYPLVCSNHSAAPYHMVAAFPHISKVESRDGQYAVPEFIAHARTALPRALATIAERGAAIHELEERVSELEGERCDLIAQRDAARADADRLAGVLREILRVDGAAGSEGFDLLELNAARRDARVALSAHAAQPAPEPSVPVSALRELIDHWNGAYPGISCEVDFCLKGCAAALAARLPSAPAREGGI